MIRTSYLSFLAMALLLCITSCSNKMGKPSAEYFTVNPSVLEVVGGEVPVTIHGKFPEKFFHKKAVLHVTPVLKWKGGEVKGQSISFQGEKVEGNHRTISYGMGGRFTLKTSFKYRPEMLKSELYLHFSTKVGGKRVGLPAVKIADGVIATSELINQTLLTARPALGEDAFQRVLREKHQENIMFLIQQSAIRSGEAKKAADFQKEVSKVEKADNKRIVNIEVSAYASPDGGVNLNTQLAENRETNTAKLVNSNLKSARVAAPVDAKYTAEDWEGFKELVAQSNLQDKDLILRVLSMYKDPVQREEEIKNISSVYKNLADEILPQLRRSRLTLHYEVVGKSDEEIASLASSNPKALTVEELLYAATLTTDTNRQTAIYEEASKLFPSDFRGLNNLGKLAYEAGELTRAEQYFQKASAIQSAPEVNMNLGLIALNKGDQATAENYLGRAANVKQLSETLGNLYVAQGKYEQAIQAFGDAKTNSAALAQLLAKDYTKAKATLEAITQADGYTDYLMAVLGARTNNLSLVTNSLKKVIVKHPTLAKKAATDLEFAKFFTNPAFTSLIR